jgi:MoaA/NifB/PqqE/SkfB family radical SAM enzyme
MYEYKDITSIHLEVTSKCQARCPMCPRRLQGGPLLDSLSLDEIDLGTFVDWFPRDFVRQLKFLNMCGNLGDPIVAKDTLEIFRYLHETNPGMSLQMHTNGSGRSKEWWQELASLNVKVVFGIDGLKDTHALYRINTDWDKIINNATHFIHAGGDARWDMLVFKHNEHQVDTCEQMSKELGFKGFSIKHTTRFKDGKLDVIDDDYNVTHTLLPSQKSLEMIEPAKKAQQEILPTINCKAKQDSQIYVSANGNVSPCCWLDLEWLPQHSYSRIDYMTKIKEYPNLHKNTMQEIFLLNFFNKISSCWTTTGLKECSKQCGTFDKLNKQFERIEHE